MSDFSFWTVILLNIITRSGSINEKLHPTFRKNIEFLCPGVDICDENATSATTHLRKFVDEERGLVSCCHSCSCHKDCHESLNCCFPDGERNDSEVSTNIDEKGDQPFVKGGMSLSNHAEKTTKIKPPTYRECVYAQTGVPDDDWIFYVPSYRIVTKPPEQGCYMARDGLKSSCDPNVTSACSDLFPVYSEEEHAIYKNEFCARCHGVDDFVAWTPLLACSSYFDGYGRFIPFSEHLTYFTHDNCNVTTNKCNIQFVYDDAEVLQENRCFVNPFGTCELPLNVTNFDMTIPEGLNMTAEEVAAACNSGLVSPVVVDLGVYTNVFCAICNDFLYTAPLCDYVTESTRGYGGRQLTFLFDTSFVQANFRDGKERETPANPKACMFDKSEKINGSCRDVLCPSGQVRHLNGKCYHPSKHIFNIAFRLTLQLDYIDVNQSALMAYTSDTANSTLGKTNAALILDTFKGTSPWPPYWKIESVYHTIAGGKRAYVPRVAVELSTDITRIDVVAKNIKTFLFRNWNITFNNEKITFRQDILGYIMRKNGTRALIPSWKFFDERIESNIDNVSLGFPIWVELYKNFQSFPKFTPYQISRLLICDQVELYQYEYILSEKRYLLYNKLTMSFMSGKQFDIVSNNQQYGVRVCLSDTPLEVKPKSSRAHLHGSPRRHWAFDLFWIWCQLQVKF